MGLDTVTLHENPRQNGGWSEWGKHQPATNQELHFAVTPASQMAAGVFPVKPITNTTYTYDAAGQMTGKSGTGVSPVSFAYDAARNLTRCWGSGFTNQYFYDHARRLVQIVSTNASGGHSTRFVYEGMDIIPVPATTETGLKFCRRAVVPLRIQGIRSGRRQMDAKRPH